MNCKDDIDALLARYFAKEPLDAAQQKRLDEWVSANTEEFKQMQKLLEVPVKRQEPIVFDAEQAWKKIEPKLEDRPFRIALKRNMTMFVSVAATVLLLIAVATFYFLRDSDKSVIHYANTGIGEKSILLPDSSQVILYSGATLAFRQENGKTGRLAQLEGKAFFQVKKMNGIPFKVETEHLNVEVLGTSFLVDAADKDNAGVFVKTGKVKVEAGNDHVVIVENEKAELKNGRLEVGVIDDPQSLFGEKRPAMIFNNVPIKEVVKEIEEKTGIRIELEKDLEKNFITTRIEGETGQDMVQELAFLCGCKYETLTAGKYYRLYSE